MKIFNTVPAIALLALVNFGGNLSARADADGKGSTLAECLSQAISSAIRKPDPSRPNLKRFQGAITYQITSYGKMTYLNKNGATVIHSNPTAKDFYSFSAGDAAVSLYFTTVVQGKVQKFTADDIKFSFTNGYDPYKAPSFSTTCLITSLTIIAENGHPLTLY